MQYLCSVTKEQETLSKPAKTEKPVKIEHIVKPGESLIFSAEGVHEPLTQDSASQKIATSPAKKEASQKKYFFAGEGSCKV